MAAANPPVTIGLPEEQADFSRRNARFLEVWPCLEDTMNRAFIRDFVPSEVAHKVIFTLGRLAVEDFMEIMVVCGNGYGIAGLKLLRPMFEATVTVRYLRQNPAEASLFLDYLHVHQRKALKLAESVGVDLSAWIPLSLQAEIETTYQGIKHHYRQVVCNKCGSEREFASWTKKDMVTMAREVGLAKSVVGLYFLPTLQIHTTAVRLDSRLEERPERILFRSGPQRGEADAVLTGAHVCLALILEEQNEYFRLGLDVEQLRRDVKYAWPVREGDS
jgi:hypothetical protein